ncbi:MULTISPECIES: poly-gamma-glutamate hydrolase family protein [Stappiaceae]|uniref:poly-gamma-glutamate hydrolase family protein n=1 Tax=Stappiaceae TaxID=2821832 RepID=UPI001AD9A548|nr:MULTISPECIES: poly-gamma-glutamate hydrolase family protein [Stappiaceae]MBO9422780.1 poly-gamma-glutamate hydrolase family protein [Labrenzia sp. R4_2]
MSHEHEYKNFEALRQNEQEDVDFSVTARTVAGSTVAIVAPHGGGIEPLTAELAESIAGTDHNYYAFNGLKKQGNKVLHITSHRFDEERALILIEPCEKVVAVHGLAGSARSVQIGGRDAALRGRIHEALQGSGFESTVVTEGAYGGMEPLNICNRGSTSAGVQLEIQAGLRRLMKEDETKYASFVEAVRSALLKPPSEFI